jgi:hypothetical protein
MKIAKNFIILMIICIAGSRVEAAKTVLQRVEKSPGCNKCTGKKFIIIF